MNKSGDSAPEHVNIIVTCDTDRRHAVENYLQEFYLGETISLTAGRYSASVCEAIKCVCQKGKIPVVFLDDPLGKDQDSQFVFIGVLKVFCINEGVGCVLIPISGKPAAQLEGWRELILEGYDPLVFPRQQREFTDYMRPEYIKDLCIQCHDLVYQRQELGKEIGKAH